MARTSPATTAAASAALGRRTVFCWIKQMLKLRHFYSVSENAGRSQVTVALTACVRIKLAHAPRDAAG